jgi:hypothetical protein
MSQFNLIGYSNSGANVFDNLDYNPATANLKLATNNTGGGSNPMLTLNQNDTATGAGSIRMYKNSFANGNAIGEVSFVAKTAIFGNPQREYARIDARIRNNNTSNVDGSIGLSARVNDVLTEIVRINGVDNQTEFLQPIDMNGNAIKTSTGNITLDGTTAPNGSGQIIINPRITSNLQINGSVNLPSVSNNFRIGTFGVGFNSNLSSQNALFNDTANGRSGELTYTGVTAITNTATTTYTATGIQTDNNLLLETTGIGTNIEFKPESSAGGIVFTGTALQSNTAGGNSGEHLVITLNGVQYKIKLENV